MAQAVDFAFSRPAPSAIKAARCIGVLRYVCADTSKRITAAEAAAYHAVGLAVALVYEDGAEDFANGANAGAAKATIAAPQLKALGVPKDRPVYCAIDGSLSPADFVLAYEGIHAFASLLGRPDAIYGPRPFLAWCQHTHGVEYLWELGSSSYNTGPEPTSGKRLQQLVGGAPIGGCDVDYNDILEPDWGQWPYVAPQPPKPKPTPPKPTPSPEAEVLHTFTTKPLPASGRDVLDTNVPWDKRLAATPQAEDGAQSKATVTWTDAAGSVRLVVVGTPGKTVAIDVNATV